jgi:stearoyl-CoA desaturase (delta-9 desaturase)
MALTITVRDIVIPFLYWSFHHNTHHFYCDTPEDLHSPIQSSFWHVQLNFTTLQQLKLKRFDFIATMPENCPVSFKKLKTGYDADLSYLTTRNLIMIFLGENIFWIGLGFILFNYSSYDIFPFELWAWVCFMPRLLVSHAANLTNSAAHMFGTRPYVGRDDGKGTYPLCKATNCWWAALLNFGEGWHNNHHAYALSARHGFLWWEVDVVYYGLYVLGMLGLIWDMQVVNDSIRLAPRDGTVNKHLTTKYDLLFVR